MDDKMRIISTEAELKIFSDPYRMKIIKTYQTFGKPLTVKQCADYMGEVPAKVHYHVMKLIGIDVLALDHVEVINGINAKYYYLPKTSFTIKLSDSESNDVLYNSLNQVEQMVVSVVDDFKKDFIQASNDAVDNKIEDPTEVGMLTSRDVYLSEEQYDELSEIITKITDNFGKHDESKKRYSFLAGFSRKK